MELHSLEFTISNNVFNTKRAVLFYYMQYVDEDVLNASIYYGIKDMFAAFLNRGPARKTLDDCLILATTEMKGEYTNPSALMQGIALEYKDHPMYQAWVKLVLFSRRN